MSARHRHPRTIPPSQPKGINIITTGLIENGVDPPSQIQGVFQTPRQIAFISVYMSALWASMYTATQPHAFQAFANNPIPRQQHCMKITTNFGPVALRQTICINECPEDMGLCCRVHGGPKGPQCARFMSARKRCLKDTL